MRHCLALQLGKVPGTSSEVTGTPLGEIQGPGISSGNLLHIAIKIWPIEIVDLPLDSMVDLVDLSSLCGSLPEGNPIERPQLR